MPVHPAGKEIAGLPSIRSVTEHANAFDAAFVGVNRDATIEIVRTLRETGAGGAICFASGFSETGADALQAALMDAAGDMAVLGPNCYGFVNALDRTAIWPDQHGCLPVDSGVAILTQSSNIAINLSMQARGLPIAMMVTVGNQAQTTQAQIAASLLDDPRVTAIGVHIEGFGALRDWEALAEKAAARGIPIVALKIGKSAAAQAAAVSHTASLAGLDAGASAFLDRLGFARVGDLPGFLEALKLLHAAGTLSGTNIATISCSGGEASLAADMAEGTGIRFPPLTEDQKSALSDALGPKVALSNPLDYHTYIWRDADAMTRAFSAMADPGLDMILLILDFPRADRCDPGDWDCAIDAALRMRAETGMRVGVVSTLPELLPEMTAAQLLAGGVVPFSGLREAYTAIEAAVGHPRNPDPVCLPGGDRNASLIAEVDAKSELAQAGLAVPQSVVMPRDSLAIKPLELPFPVALKSIGLAHKSEMGGVVLGLQDSEAIGAAAASMPGDEFLVEEMVTGAVAELLVGVIRDPAHGFVLTVGAGGVLTEILDDVQCVLVPASRESVETALKKLKIAPVLAGFRGKPAADIDALLDQIDAIQTYVLAMADRLEEVEVNPLLALPEGAVAVDALIRRSP